MSKTAVVYWSGTGNTEAMSEYLVNAINEKGDQAELFPVDSFDVSTADAYDAFALGCSAWGSEELEANEFLPVYEEIEPRLGGKKVLLFGSYVTEMPPTSRIGRHAPRRPVLRWSLPWARSTPPRPRTRRHSPLPPTSCWRKRAVRNPIVRMESRAYLACSGPRFCPIAIAAPKA